MGELLLPDKRPNFPYQAQDGRHLRNSEVNRHHVFWENRQYRTELEKTFREIGGLLVPMVITWHDDLHANLKQPRKPHRGLMEDMIDYAKAEKGNPYLRFARLTRFVIRHAETEISPEKADNAQKIATNLLLQQSFIDKGAVEIRIQDEQV